MTFIRSTVATACAAVSWLAAPLHAPAQTDSPRLREPASAAAATTSFNPDVSLILQGRYRHGSDIGERRITGFLPGGDHGDEHGGERGFSLGHTELVISASVDPYFRGYFALAVAPEGGTEIEEAWFQTLALGRGLSAKGGRFLSGIGYANELHPHAWDSPTRT